MWIIQNDIFGSDQEKMESSLKSLGIEFVCADWLPYPNYEIMSMTQNSYPLFARGSVEFVGRFERQPLLTIKNYDCSKYYKYFLSNMLNEKRFFVPWHVFVKQANLYFDWFNTDKIFVRPNSGKKIFTGNYIGKLWTNQDINAIMSLPDSKIQDDDVVLVSAYTDLITSECRVLFYKNEVIDSSYYSTDGDEINKDVIEAIAYEFALQAKWYPDYFWVMDIACLGSGFKRKFKIVEINNLFTAGWYDCDYKKVIQCVMGSLCI